MESRGTSMATATMHTFHSARKEETQLRAIERRDEVRVRAALNSNQNRLENF